jgi:hypothetical protein
MLDEMGIGTGLDSAEILAAAHDVAAILDIQPRSHRAGGATRAGLMDQARQHPRNHPA